MKSLMAKPTAMFANKTLSVNQMADVTTGQMSSIKLEWISEPKPPAVELNQQIEPEPTETILIKTENLQHVPENAPTTETVSLSTQRDVICGDTVWLDGATVITDPNNLPEDERMDIQRVEEIVIANSNGHEPTPEIYEEVIYPQDNDYVEIQVTEEVVTDTWDGQSSSVVVVGDTKVPKAEDDIEIPLPENQDLYSQLHPYPCDFCSRRFSKKSTLMNHMVTHQSERPHGCNLCGARYRRKCDLVNHMKIHAYAPVRSNVEDDEDEDLPKINQVSLDNSSKGRRKKAQLMVPKKNTIAEESQSNGRSDYKNEKKHGRGRYSSKREADKSSSSKLPTNVNDDMRLLMELSENTEREPRWPIIDESRPYVCQQCGVGFAREKALASHSRIHAGDSAIECEACGEMFLDMSSLREHIRTKHPHLGDLSSNAFTSNDKYGSYSCDTCGAIFNKLELLKRHRRTHVKDEPLDDIDIDPLQGSICNYCHQMFDNTIDLREHIEIHHTSLNNSHNSGLSSSESHRCSICGHISETVAEMSEHVRSYHSYNSQENSCHVCGKVCKDRRSLLKHSWVHSENRSFPCQSCNKRFHNRARLRRHMMSHRDKAVNCSDCGEEFPDGRALMSHRHSHNNSNSNQPIRSFPCHDCGKTFGSRSSQQIHVRIHTGERPYGCKYCWKAFADGGTLRKHERIHTGEKPYVCPICPKAFNQRVVLREHIRAHHSGSDCKVNSKYECKVCSYLFGTSSELCLHLVQHSDENTAKHRLPSVGPRKYKRRRNKLVSHEPSSFSLQDYQENEQTGDYFSDSSDSQVEKKKIFSRRKKTQRDDYDRTRRLSETAGEDFHDEEQKKIRLEKVAKKNKLKAANLKLARSEKRAKAAKLMNSTSYASKYVVSRPDDDKFSSPNSSFEMSPIRKNSKNSYNNEVDLAVETIVNGADSRNRPRTKNVSYHNMKTGTNLEQATFPPDKGNFKKQRGRKSSLKKDGSSKYKFNVEQENIPLNVNSVVEENIECSVVDDLGDNIKLEPVADCMVKTEIVTTDLLACEMCSEMFSDRNDLINHIRVHI